MTKVGTGYLRGQQATQPVLAEGRGIKRANADNPAVAQPGDTAAVPHDSRSGLAKSASVTRPLDPSSHGRIVPITQGPPSSRPPRKAL